jgi:hypothetical protein
MGQMKVLESDISDSSNSCGNSDNEIGVAHVGISSK